MSRLGKKPIVVPETVEVLVEGQHVAVKGPKGELALDVHRELSAHYDGEKRLLLVQRPSDSGTHKALHGLTRSLLANMVEGVVAGFEKQMRLIGIGYSARLEDEELVLRVGFSHLVHLRLPEGIEVETSGPVSGESRIVVRGIDKQAVGQFAANIRRVKPPEPYKGKGIRYVDEVVRQKVGKAFATGVR